MLPNCADMAVRRLVYLAAVFLSGIFYIANGQWLSYLILMTVLLLPWFSLLLSLPALLRFRAAPSCPGILSPGQEAELWLLGNCPFPMPPFRGRLKLTRLISGEKRFYQDRSDLSTDHCGGIQVTAESVRVCDYLGLFSFPVRCREPQILLIRPHPVAMTLPEDLQKGIIRSWQPKNGGFAENHELRLYRPGDSLNQIHWKLSAKTGDLILRQSMEPRQGLFLLTMNLRGSPEELDRMLGRFLWLGNHLAEKSFRFELRALTAAGILTFSLKTREDVTKALDTLLCSGAASQGDLREQPVCASWHCHIGGEPDEA